MKIIISIPHSSKIILDKFKNNYLKPLTYYYKHIDYGVDTFCKLEGFDFIEAEVSRFVVDLNRERNDIGSNHGVIILKDWDNNLVFKKKPSTSEIETMLKKYYDPYYLKIKKLIGTQKDVFLLDCHSMDSHNHDDGTRRPDICLATNNGKSCSGEIVKVFKEEFEKAGFHVEIDNPYSGSRANIVKYANRLGVGAMELEFNKAIYMDEMSFKIDEIATKKLKKILVNILDKTKIKK